MKLKNILYFIAAGLLFTLSACEKEKIEVRIPEAAIYIDRSSFRFEENFANYPGSTKEVTLELKINVTGAPQNYDRAYQWVAEDSSTAVAGRDYEFAEKNFTVKAGELTGTTELKLLRNDDLGEEKVFLYLKLVPGKDFQTKINGFEEISTISVYDKLDEPPYWYWFAYEYLDEYSEKKFRLLQEIAGMPEDALSTLPESDREFERLIGKLKMWGIILKRYLEEQEANGTPVLEEDGSPMMYGYYLD